MGFLGKIRPFLRECRRVWIVTKKPSSDEFKIVVKVSAIGILIIGTIGFLIRLMMQVVK